MLGTAWEAGGLWGLEASRSGGMEAARPRKVLGLRDAVGITGDEDRERGSLAAARLVSSSVWQPSEAQPPPCSLGRHRGAGKQSRAPAGGGKGPRPAPFSSVHTHAALSSVLV